MEHCQSVANSLLELLLTFKSVGLEFNGVFVSENEWIEKIKEIKLKHKIKMPLDQFVDICRRTYADIIKRCNGKARSYAGILLNPSNIKLISDKTNKDGTKEKNPLIPSDCLVLREKGVLPIANDLSSSLRFSVAQDVIGRLTSIEEMQKEYEESRKKWELELQSSKDAANLEKYGNLLSDIRKIASMKKFNIDNYKKFLNRWRGTKMKDGTRKNDGMFAYFNSLSQDHKFTESDKFRFGYDPEFMNLIFKHRDLWDIIGKQSYVDVVFNCFHWKKEHIGVSSFKTLNRIGLGKNFLRFCINKKDNKWIMTVKGISNNAKELIEFQVLPPPNTSFELIDDENQVYKIRYSRDSKQKTWYVGLIKEPHIRYNVSRDKFLIDFSVSEHKEEGKEENKLLAHDKWFLKTTPKYPSQKEKKYKNLMAKSYNILGVDIGVARPFAAVVWSTERGQDGNLHKVEEKAIICSNDNPDKEKKIQKLKLIDKTIDAMNVAINVAMEYLYDNKEIKGVYCRKERSISWSKILNYPVEKYKEYLDKNKSKDAMESLSNIRKPANGWFIYSCLNELKKMMYEFKSAYFNTIGSENKRKYTTLYNKVDESTYLLKQAIRKFRSLRFKISTIGTTSAEQHFKKGFASKDLSWFNGICRKINNVNTADVVNAARKNTCDIIAMEDLDCELSLFNSTEDNNMKSLMSVGEIKKYIANKAGKHNIAVIPVDPDNTTTVEYNTGLLGHVCGRTLHIFDGENHREVDRDLNAARNIAQRCIERNSDIRRFPVEKLDENTYILALSSREKGGERRRASIYRWTKEITKKGIEECAFVRNEDGSFSAVKLTDDIKKMKKINDTKTYMFLHGKQWRLYHDLQDEVEKKYNDFIAKPINIKSDKISTDNRNKIEV